MGNENRWRKTVGLGRDTKKVIWWEQGRRRRSAVSRAEFRLWASHFMQPWDQSGGERSWSCAAVSRSTTAIGPPHLGQRQSGSDS